MPPISHDFQVFVKPVGSSCNLDCRYCYYLDKEHLYPSGETFRMREDVLENYIAQHIEASPGEVVNFSWHGGEPTLLGLDFYRLVIELQRRYTPAGRRIVNGIQTNGTLLDDEWCSFLKKEGFYVGISLDGPKAFHDLHRLTKKGDPTYDDVIRGYGLLMRHGVDPEILCVVNADNVGSPLAVYRFFKQIGARYISFLPLVEPEPGSPSGVSALSVPAEAWGQFLSTVFDEWIEKDIGVVKVQMFEEALRIAFRQPHSLCIFRSTCGDVPVLEHNGDFYSCDHFVDSYHLLGNIGGTPLAELLTDPRLVEFGEAKRSSLLRACVECEVREMCNGECPKNRFCFTSDGEPGLNYLCEGYKVFFTHVSPFVSEVASLWGLGMGSLG